MIRIATCCVLFLALLAFVPAGLTDDKPAVQRHEVEVVRDINYNDRPVAILSPKQKLDLYIPKGVKHTPVVMFIHGGGYQRGDREEGQEFGRVLASRGVIAAVISYRLYPEVKHPGHIEDVARSFAWLKKNVAKHGGNPVNIFVSGHSAGAHLASLLATDKSYLKAENLELSDIRGVIALSGYRILAIRKDVFGDEKAME